MIAEHSIDRPLLVGLHNPYSGHPDDALVPFPPGSSGERLLRLIQDVDPRFSEDDYYRAFDRTNLWRGRLLPHGYGTRAAYLAEGERVLGLAMGRDDCVLLGSRVWDSVMAGRRRPAPLEQITLNGMTRFWLVPHPSERNLVFTNAELRRRAGELLLKMARP